MASIISFIGSLDAEPSSQIPSGIPSWDGTKSFSENLVLYPLEEQIRCCLDQLLAISYYLTFYGRGCHELVNEFIDEFMIDLRTRVIPLGLKQYPTGPYFQVVSALVLLEKFTRTGNWDGDVDIDLVKDILINHPFQVTPTAWNIRGVVRAPETNFIPFLMLMNRHVHPDYTTYNCRDIGLNVFSFQTTGYYKENAVVKVRLAAYPYPIGDSFSMKETPDGRFDACPLIRYMSQFNTGARDFNTIIGAIGASCLTMDVMHSQTSSSQKLAATVAAHVMGMCNVSGSIGGFEPFSYVEDRRKFFKLLADFLEYLHKHYGTVASYDGPVVKLFSCFAETKQQKETVEYIRKHGGSASADLLGNSQEGLCIGTEALTFISQSPSLLSAQSQVTEPKAEEKAEEKKTETSKEETKTETKEDEAEADSTKDDDTEQDLGEDDTSDSDEKSEDSKPDQKDDSSSPKEDKPAQQQEAPSEPVETEEQQVNTSDITGFEFKTISAESETIDSVMFKEEMSSFLSNVLANPPDGLSPQNVSVLTALQRFWLHSLSIEAIVGIVGSCLKQLPKSLIQLNTKLYGVKRQ